MALLNYTTSIAVSKTVGELHDILARHDAKSVAVDYADGQPSGLTFVIPTRFGDRRYHLPANIAGVAAVLARQYAAGRIERRYSTPEHAARVGWRIIKDAIAAETARIEAGMATLDEIMTPYLQLEPGGPTLYQEMVTHEMKLLPERTP